MKKNYLFGPPTGHHLEPFKVESRRSGTQFGLLQPSLELLQPSLGLLQPSLELLQPSFGLLQPSSDPRFTSCVLVHGMGGTGKVSFELAGHNSLTVYDSNSTNRR